MKKFKNAAQLREKTMELRIRELELEKALRKDWAEIKETMNPQTMLKKNMTNPQNGHLLLNSLSIASSLLSSKLLEKAEKNIEARVETKMKNFGHRLGTLFLKKK
jgi:hypothetical protein